MDTHSNQTISGHKTLEGNIVLSNDLQIDSKIDGVDINELIKQALMYNVPQNITAFKTFTSVKTSSFQLLNCTSISDCPWLDIFEKLRGDTVRKSDTDVKVNGTKTFTDDVTVLGNVTVVGDINNVSFPDAFLLQGENETVSGTYTFSNVTFNDNVTTDTFNGYNLSELYQRALRKTGDNQVVTQHWTFINETNFHKDLHVDGTIDGINLTRDALLTNQNHSFLDSVSFKNNIHVKELIAGNMTVSGLIDGVNLTALKEDLVTLSDDIIIKGKKIFENHVSFAGNWTILGLIDGVNISDLDRRAMRLENEQVVTGTKVFLSTLK
jgi:hypothetical protein